MVSPSLHASYGDVSQICHSMNPRGLGSAGLGDFENLFQPGELNDCVGLGKGNNTWHFMG